MKRNLMGAALALMGQGVSAGPVSAEQIAWAEADGSQPAAGPQAAVWPPVQESVQEPVQVPGAVWGLIFKGEVMVDDFQVLRGMQ